MTNKRDLKKIINCICSELFAECMASSLYNGKTTKENVDALMQSILVIHNDYIRRISHPEPGMKPKKYYNNIIEEFKKQVDEIIDQIDNLN